MVLSHLFFLAVLGLAGFLMLAVTRMSGIPERYQRLSLGLLALSIFAAYFAVRSQSFTARFFLLGAAAGLVIFQTRLNHYYNFRRINSWARKNGFRLTSFADAESVEETCAWVFSEHQEAFRIEAQDKNGQARKGWIIFGSYWGLDREKVRVEFDDERPADSLSASSSHELSSGVIMIPTHNPQNPQS